MLATRFHRVARLAQPESGDGKGWQHLFETYFPRGGEHALRLWEDWRCQLLKDEMPGKGVAISHGQPEPHWQIVLPHHQLFINLESMWDDYTAMVDRLIDACGQDARLRTRLLQRWARRRWTVQLVSYVSPAAFRIDPAVASASVTNSAAIGVISDPTATPTPQRDA